MPRRMNLTPKPCKGRNKDLPLELNVTNNFSRWMVPQREKNRMEEKEASPENDWKTENFRLNTQIQKELQ